MKKIILCACLTFLNPENGNCMYESPFARGRFDAKKSMSPVNIVDDLLRSTQELSPRGNLIFTFGNNENKTRIMGMLENIANRGDRYNRYVSANVAVLLKNSLLGSTLVIDGKYELNRNQVYLYTYYFIKNLSNETRKINPVLSYKLMKVFKTLR